MLNACGARGLLVTQNKSLAAMCNRFGTEPMAKVFVASMMFDETTETLALPTHARLLPQVRKSRWHVLVNRQRFQWCVRGEDGVMHQYSWECLRPPVPVVITDGPSIFDGLFTQFMDLSKKMNFKQAGPEILFLLYISYFCSL